MISDIDANVRKKLDEFMNCNHKIIIGDSPGTSAALTEKELIKTDTIDMMDMIVFFILKYIRKFNLSV